MALSPGTRLGPYEVTAHSGMGGMGRVVLGAVILLAILVAAVAMLVPLTSGRARKAVVDELSERLNGEVQLDSLSVGLLPLPHATGSGLSVRFQGRWDVPPLITIDEFTVRAGLFGLLRHHVGAVALEGLTITIPPKRPDAGGAVGDAIDGSWVIDRLESSDTTLSILSGEPDRDPKVWRIHELRMRDVGNRSMPFQAVLANAVPPGQIDVNGNFGPWASGDPGATPLDGAFTFADADLSVFKGIAGILSAKGTFGGSLSRVEVHGETDTPEFVVQAGGHPVHLRTTYHAIVDGLNGNTLLQPVDARFNDTRIIARGGVVDSNPGAPGREVQLDVTVEEGRLEDVLLFAVRSDPPLRGALELQAKMVLPPGDRDVAQKLELDGSFTLTDAAFASRAVTRKIAELSERGRGELDGDNAPVSSDFAGRFTLGNGQLAIPAVSFRVPGAVVRMTGTYGIADEAIDFKGSLFTDVKVSEMTSGWKSFLLKLVDPLFNRDGGGAEIPIQVSGTRSAPSFGLDKGRVF